MTISMTKQFNVTGCNTTGEGITIMSAIVHVPAHLTDVEKYLRRVEKRRADGEIFKPWNSFETIKFREIK